MSGYSRANTEVHISCACFSLFGNMAGRVQGMVLSHGVIGDLCDSPRCGRKIAILRFHRMEHFFRKEKPEKTKHSRMLLSRQTINQRGKTAAVTKALKRHILVQSCLLITFPL